MEIKVRIEGKYCMDELGHYCPHLDKCTCDKWELACIKMDRFVNEPLRIKKCLALDEPQEVTTAELNAINEAGETITKNLIVRDKKGGGR